MSYIIASLDIETYSLKKNAAIIEAGLVFVDVEKPKAYLNLEDSLGRVEGAKFWENVIPFPLPEQLLLGRSVDPDTLVFHVKTQKTMDPHFQLGISVFPLESRYDSSWTLASAFEQLRSILRNYEVREVWVNHTSFDCAALISLWETFCDYHSPGQKAEPLWHYQAERDISTLREYLPIEKDPNRHAEAKPHRALPDAWWNLRELHRCSAELSRLLVE